MKLSDLQPGWVYRVASGDYSVEGVYAYLVYAATGDPIEDGALYRRSRSRLFGSKVKSQRTVLLHPVDVGGRTVSTIRGTESRRGLSISDAVCPLADWPAELARIDARGTALAEAEHALAVRTADANKVLALLGLSVGERLTLPLAEQLVEKLRSLEVP